MQKKLLTEEFYSEKRYWYHLSSTLSKKKELLRPRDNDEGFNRSDNEPNTKRICVSPTLEQCLTAVPYSKTDKYFIYRTSRKVIAKKSREVFDSEITQEGWLTISTSFIRIGTLNIEDVNKQQVKVKYATASDGNLELSKELYKWWVRINPWRFVKKN